MLKVKNNLVFHEELPLFLHGLSQESLYDLSWTDPVLGVSGCAWWPEEDQSPSLKEFERYGAETLTVDIDNKRVLVVKHVEPWSVEEMTAFMTAQILILIKAIDADADAIYAAALGNRATEYAQAEEQALAFRDLAYTGTVPAYVQSWATATGNTAQWAADNIIATSDAWRMAQIAIRAHRLDYKEQARKATTQDELDMVSATWAAFVTSIKAQLGIA